jgi:hypothetical protein
MVFKNWIHCWTEVTHIRVFTKHSSWRKCRKKFRRKYPGNAEPCKATMQSIITKLRFTRSTLDKNKSLERYLLFGWKFVGSGTPLETTLIKSLLLLGIRCRTATSTAHFGTNSLKLRPLKYNSRPYFLTSYYEARIRCCRRFHDSIFNGLFDRNLNFILKSRGLI